MNLSATNPSTAWDLLEAFPDATVVTDKDGRIRFVNEQTLGLFGYTRDELLGRSVEFLLPERFRAAHPGHRSGYFSDPRKGRKGTGTGLELFGRRKDGTEFPAEIVLAPTPSAQGVLVTAAVRDITERKRAEALLRASEARYRSALDNMMEGVQILGFDWRYLYLNDAAARNGRQRKEEMLGRTAMERYPGFETTELFAKLRRCMEERAAGLAESEFTFPDATKAWFELSIQPVPEGLFVRSLDITARKQVELELRAANADLERRVQLRTAQLEEVNRELESFSYSVAHDLRAPIRSIDGFSQALLEDHRGRLDAEGQKFLGFIRGSTQQMMQLIDDLLGLSQVTRSELRHEVVDLTALARTAVTRLQRCQPHRRVNVVIQERLTARGDPRLLTLLIENLLGNAWKFTAKRAEAHIEFGASSADGRPVYFVRDNGAGFDMAFAHKLFGVFQRLHAAAEFEGTGVGLATVQRVVNRHGGRIWAHGEVNGGATFSFTLHEAA